MNPRALACCENSKHGDDQINTFKIDNDKLLIIIVSDGVSDSTCGHIASSFLCYYIEDYFRKQATKGLFYAQLKTYATNAIQYAVAELRAFSKDLTDFYNLTALTTNHIDEFKEKGLDGIDPLDADELQEIKAIKNTGEIAKGITASTTKTGETVVWKKYEQICAAFKYKWFDKNKEKILTEILAGNPCTFESTLSLNLLYGDDNDEYEILSVNYGDPELYIIEWDDKVKKIISFISHYKIGQDALHSFIDAETPGINGRPIILTRNLSINSSVIVVTDGANMHYTTSGGFPYSPFQNQFAGYKKGQCDNTNFPEIWHSYLQKNNAITDDYSMVMVDFRPYLSGSFP